MMLVRMYMVTLMALGVIILMRAMAVLYHETTCWRTNPQQ